jgi:hypothetical protein
MIERGINRLTRDRRMATRSEKLARSDLALVTIAMILEWLSLCRQTLGCHTRPPRSSTAETSTHRAAWR